MYIYMYIDLGYKWGYRWFHYVHVLSNMAAN
jgi:hypothetical protein